MPLNNYDDWFKAIFADLRPGFYRVFDARVIDRQDFPDTRESFAGFLCPICRCSVRTDHRLQGFPELHLYACARTGVTIRLPYDPLQQWHRSAFVGVRQTSPVLRSSGGADRNDLIVGICDSEQHS